MKVICISGKAGSGKDTAAGFLKEALEEQGQRVLIAHYGDLLKYICKTFFGWNGEKDEAGRTLLQQVGTDCIRRQMPDYWVDFLIEMLSFFPERWDYVLIPDTRFPNEYGRLLEDGFSTSLVRIRRPGNASALTEEQRAHPSETAMDGMKYDVIIRNSGSLEHLRKRMKDLAKVYSNGLGFDSNDEGGSI